MLVYVNNFKLKENSIDELFEKISIWLSDKFKKNNITPDFLRSGKELNIKNSNAFIRTYNTSLNNEEMYSILISHPDRKIRGRQWITEIGIKQKNNKANIFILLETSDISTKVQETPSTTKPKLINLLYKAHLIVDDTIGIKHITIYNEKESFQNFRHEVYDKNRKYPIVIVSKSSKTRNFLIDFKMINSQLLGLAKVFCLDDNVNTYELQNEIGKNFSVWDGSIRIIYPTTNKTVLFRSQEIERLESENKKFSQELLSYITHITNVYKKPEHFSPSDLRAIRYRHQRDTLKRKQESNDVNIKEYDELLKQQDVLIKELENKLKKHREENLNLEIEIEENKKIINEKNYYISTLKNSKTENIGNAIICYGKENDLYNGEIKELIIKAIEKYQNGIELNCNSRQSVLLKDILENNRNNNKAEYFKKRCKEIFANYEKVTPKIESQLREIGLCIKQGKTHNEIKFITDNRFKVTFSKSTSDKIRAGKKISTDIDSELFY